MFYKVDNGSLLESNSVFGPSYLLIAEYKDQYQYPVDGWVWYNSREIAEKMIADNLIPKEISAFQARAVLLLNGLLDQVEILIQNSDPIVQLAWNTNANFMRTSPSVISLGHSLGLSETDIDQLFISGSQIFV